MRVQAITRANQNPADQGERPELIHEFGHEILVQRMMPKKASASLERVVEGKQQAKSAEDHPGEIVMKDLWMPRGCAGAAETGSVNNQATILSIDPAVLQSPFKVRYARSLLAQAHIHVILSDARRTVKFGQIQVYWVEEDGTTKRSCYTVPA